MSKKLKIAIIYNEANAELYHKKANNTKNSFDFVPYFEVDHTTPMEEYEYIAEKLSSEGLEVFILNLRDNLDLLIKTLKTKKPDVIFNFVEIFKDDPKLEMNIVGLFELLGFAYTGAPPLALANCQSKVLTKRILSNIGLQTPKFIIIKEPERNYRHGLKFPLIVKPVFEDASVGIENESIVFDSKQLTARVEFVMRNFKQPALIEEFIEGRELNISILGDTNPLPLPISEIDFTQMPNYLHNIVSYQAKWDPYHEAYHKTIPVCPAVLPKRIEKKAKEIALKAFKAMGVRDYARVDMRLAKDNQLYVLEVNPNPDLTEGAGFMRSAEAAGLSYSKALKEIVMLAYERGKSSK
jgi:D-alanine-D-alanine ligase